MAEAILAGGAAAAGAWRPWRVRAGPWRRWQPRGRLDAALELPHGRIRAGRGVSSLLAGTSLPGRERRAAPALLRPASPPPWRRGLELSGSTGDGGVQASASGLPFSPSSPSISLSCGCRIRLRGAVTRRPELGPAAGLRGSRRDARSLGPALRGAGGAWPRSAAARSGPRGGWARPAAGRWSPDGRARFFLMTWPRSPSFFWCGNRIVRCGDC